MQFTHVEIKPAGELSGEQQVVCVYPHIIKGHVGTGNEKEP